MVEVAKYVVVAQMCVCNSGPPECQNIWWVQAYMVGISTPSPIAIEL